MANLSFNLPERYTITDIEVYKDQELFQEIKELRKLAWMGRGAPNNGRPLLWEDIYDNGGHFSLIYKGNELIASARMTLHDDAKEELPGGPIYNSFDSEFIFPLAEFSSLVVLPEHKGLGLGKMLFKSQIKLAQSLGAGCIGLDCKVDAVPYYEQYGFKSCLLYTSDAADDMQCVDLGGPRRIKKKKNT